MLMTPNEDLIFRRLTEINQRVNHMHLLIKRAFRRIERLEMDSYAIQRELKDKRIEVMNDEEK